MVIGAVGAVLLLAAYALASACAVWLGAACWVGWRRQTRDELRRDPIARHLFGPYESPFPWHR